MSGLVVPQVVYGLSNDELAELVAKALKEIDWAFNGNISDQNISRIANFLASKTELKHISGIVGISGYDPGNPEAIRIWAGHADKTLAPFRVQQNGAIYATNAFITGLITGSTIIGGVIKTAETGARIELEDGVLKGYSEDEKLHGLVFSPTPVSNFFDLFMYHDGAKILEFIDNAVSVTIRGASDSIGMILGGTSKPTFGAGTWSFTGDVSFDNIIDGNITGNAGSAYYADNAGIAAAADSLAPSGNIAWGQVLKSGSNIADLATKNLSSLNDDSNHRTVTDIEKSTWNAKASITQEAWHAATLLNSWTNIGSGWATASYFKDNMGIVHLKGLVASGTMGAEILTLPVGYRPVDQLMLTTVANAGGASDVLGRLNIEPTGSVVPIYGGNTYYSLSGLSFRAEQ